jgi:nitrogen fixation/metabolism regulation signal transduction histidine kinase
VLSALVALLLARGLARPIRTLQEGAELIGEGKLDHGSTSGPATSSKRSPSSSTR